MDPVLARHTEVLAIIGDTLTVRGRGATAGELVEVLGERDRRLGRVVQIDDDHVTIQVFQGTTGLSVRSSVRFLGKPLDVACSPHLLGRVMDGAGRPIDGGPSLDDEPRIAVAGPTVNPMKRVKPERMIRTDVPMIDVFNCLVESQKIPIFSVAGEPHSQLLARVAVQADADVVVFGGLGLVYDDFHFFRTTFEEAGVTGRTIQFVNLASDPIVERILVPDLVLAVAERLAVEDGRRVLVLLTDMTAFADALKEIGVALEHVPANRGYTGDLYSQLARRYEKACDFQGAGSVTILAVTTMPGNDLTHPVPDNTGYITEGQYYLHDGVLDPFGSLSRLKQNVIGRETREDHGPLANTMVRLYASAREARQKQTMAFELTPFDEKCIKYGTLFKERFMDVGVRLPLDEALDLGWRTLAECFDRDELLLRKELLDRWFPEPGR